MTDKRILWEMPDGTIRMTVPVRGSRNWLTSATEEEWFDLEAAKVAKNPGMKGAVRLANRPISELPLTAKWGRVWKKGAGGKIEVDLGKCRALKMAEIRADRGRRFARLDEEWMKATGQGDTARAGRIEAARQALRDIPQTIDLAAIATPEELESFEPAWPALPA